MKSIADETARGKELDIPVKFFEQIQTSATVRIPHPEIWISKSSDMGETDCPTTNTISPQPLFDKGSKPVWRVHF